MHQHAKRKDLATATALKDELIASGQKPTKDVRVFVCEERPSSSCVTCPPPSRAFDPLVHGFGCCS